MIGWIIPNLQFLEGTENESKKVNYEYVTNISHKCKMLIIGETGYRIYGASLGYSS